MYLVVFPAFFFFLLHSDNYVIERWRLKDKRYNWVTYQQYWYECFLPSKMGPCILFMILVWFINLRNRNYLTLDLVARVNGIIFGYVAISGLVLAADRTYLLRQIHCSFGLCCANIAFILLIIYDCKYKKAKTNGDSLNGKHHLLNEEITCKDNNDNFLMSEGGQKSDYVEL